MSARVRFIGDKKGWTPIPGIPQDGPAEEFDRAVKEYEAQADGWKGSIEASGLYERYEPKEPAKPAAKKEDE